MNKGEKIKVNKNELSLKLMQIKAESCVRKLIYKFNNLKEKEIHLNYNNQISIELYKVIKNNIDNKLWKIINNKIWLTNFKLWLK